MPAAPGAEELPNSRRGTFSNFFLANWAWNFLNPLRLQNGFPPPPAPMLLHSLLPPDVAPRPRSGVVPNEQRSLLFASSIAAALDDRNMPHSLHTLPTFEQHLEHLEASYRQRDYTFPSAAATITTRTQDHFFFMEWGGVRRSEHYYYYYSYLCEERIHGESLPRARSRSPHWDFPPAPTTHRIFNFSHDSIPTLFAHSGFKTKGRNTNGRSVCGPTTSIMCTPLTWTNN